MIHFIFKLLSLLLVSRADYEQSTNIYEDSEILKYKEGTVGTENFVYYYIHHSGGIVLSLSSSTGDADMYVSETKAFPTFYPDTYDLHSATCGVDIIEIPSGFKSPISVGIYGHSANEVSNFVLQVLKDPGTDRAFVIVHDELPQHNKDTTSVPDDEIKNKNVRSKVKRKAQEPTQKVSGIYSLFEILGLIFL